MVKEIKLPKLGEGIDSAEVSEINVALGDAVTSEDTILIIESDKVSMEIPATAKGLVSKISVKVGSKVQVGQPLISIDLNKNITDENINPIPKENFEKSGDNITEIKEPVIKNTDLVVEYNHQNGNYIFASPGVRRLSRELNINLNIIKGTGSKGRITKEDLHNYIKIQMALSSGNLQYHQPEIDFSQWGNIEIQKLTKINIITGHRLKQAWESIPHVTQFDKADITNLNQYRRDMNKISNKNKIKLTFLPFIMKAATFVLKEMPKFNSSLDYKEENLVIKYYYHLGIAIDTPNGLVVPVIRDVDKKSIIELSQELIDLSNRAKNKKLKPDELKSGTFTISSLGGIGGTYFTPIINPPEVAILGISQSWWDNIFDQEKQSQSPRYIMPFSLSYDHRVIDGAMGALFTSRFSKVLSDISNFTDK